MKYLTYLLIFLLSLVFAFAQESHPKGEMSFEQGDMQSPVNIVTSQCEVAEHMIDIHYQSSHEHVLHGPHTVKIDYDPGSFIVFDGERFEFLQFHFHTPSEHHLDGREFPLEMHMVHYRKDSLPRYLVIGILFQEGAEDSFIKHFINNVPKEVAEVDFPFLEIDVNEELMPRDLSSYYHYDGSLTTPPYTETVEWLIISEIHEASREQLEKLESLEGHNNRKIQALNDRVVQECHSRTITYRF